MLEVTIQDHLEVAHFMKDFPEGHPNRRMHGHSYILKVTLRSEEVVDFVEEYEVFRKKLSSVLEKYCHTCVNDWGIKSANPTMENMCVFLWTKVVEALPKLHRLTLERPTLNMSVVYEGKK